MMRAYLILILTITFFGTACQSDQAKSKAFANAVSKDMSKEIEIPTKNGKVDTLQLPKIEFEETVYDFGKVHEGEKVEHVFKFKNTGAKDLRLLYSNTTCGCTVPDFSKEPIPPGGSGSIKVVFDTKGKKMAQNKKVKIYTNTYPNMTVLTMKGYVIPNK